MKKILTIFLIALSTVCFAQKKDSIKYDTLKLSDIQLVKLAALDKQALELQEKQTQLQEKQKDLLELIFNKPIDKITIRKYENGKFIYTTKP